MAEEMISWFKSPWSFLLFVPWLCDFLCLYLSSQFFLTSLLRPHMSITLPYRPFVYIMEGYIWRVLGLVFVRPCSLLSISCAPKASFSLSRLSSWSHGSNKQWFLTRFAIFMSLSDLSGTYQNMFLFYSQTPHMQMGSWLEGSNVMRVLFQVLVSLNITYCVVIMWFHHVHHVHRFPRVSHIPHSE